MKRKSISKFILLALFIILSSMIIGCSPDNKDMVLSDDVKEESDADKKDMVKSEEVIEEKNILVSNDVKKEAKEQEMDTFRLEKLKELHIYGEELDPVCWKDDENIIAFNRKGDNDNTYEIFNINTNTSKVKKINTIKNAVWRTSSTIIHTKRVLYLNNLKFYIYDLVDDTTKEVYDLSSFKEEIEEEYRDFYIKKYVNDAGHIHYGIVKRENKTDPKFNLKSDIEFVRIFSTNLVRESDKYISIISRSPNNDGEIIRILDLDTGEIVKSKPFKFEKRISLKLINSDGFMYNKVKDAFYMRKPWSICEYRLSDPNSIKEVKEIKKMSVSCRPFISPGDEKNIYFADGDRVDEDEEGGAIVRYNMINDKFTILLKDKPKGYYSSINVNSNSNIISYNYFKTPFTNYNDKYTFIGVIDGDKIRNIQKLPVEKLYDKYDNFNFIIFNELGNRFIYKVAYNYEKENIRYRAAKYYVYEIKNP